MKAFVVSEEAEGAGKLTLEMLFSVYDSLTDFVVFCDHNGVITSTNNSFLKSLGFSTSSKLIGRNFKELFVLKDQKQADELKTRISKTNSEKEIEFTLSGKNGAELFVELNASPILNSDGYQTGFASVMRNITKPRKAEQEMAQAKKLLQLITDNIPYSVFWKDKNSVYVWANKNYANNAKVEDPENIIGKTDYDLPWKKEETDWYRECDKKVLENDTPMLNFHESFLKQDGSLGWIEISKIPIHDESGQVIGLLGSYIDITQRKTAEDALRASEENLRSLMQNAKDFFFYRIAIDPDNPLKVKTVLVSPSITEVFGISNSENFDAWLERIHPEDFPRIMAANLRSVEFGELFDQCYRTFHQLRNEWVWGRSISNPVRDKNGKITHFNGITIDITKIKMAEEALAAMAKQNQEAALRYEALIGASNTGAWEFHADTGFLWCSPEYFSMLGRNINDFDLSGNRNLEQTWINLLHPEDKEAAHKKFLAYLEKPEGMYQQTFRLLHGEGHWVWIWSRGKTLRDKDGKITEVTVGTHIDITERRKLEVRLSQAEKMEAIGQLAGGIAHDFNNQLTGILGNAELILQDLDDPTLRPMVQNIISASLRAAELTKQLLAFARKGLYISTVVNVHDLILEVIRFLQRSIDKRILISQQFEAVSPTTIGDPTQLQNALLNLALNSRDAMPNGGDLIFSTSQIDLQPKASDSFVPPGKYLQICVTDTGSGMGKETLSHIFEPFFTTKEKGKGTGLGLAAVYGTIQNHHGTISVSSELGKGTTFKILLPHVSEVKFETIGNETIPAIKGQARILLVDDDKISNQTTGKILESLGYRVTPYFDSHEAIEHYKSFWKQIDLVMLDIVMPKIGGRDTFLALRTINPNIKAFIASGFSINGEARQILEDGVLGFIQKPFQISELSRIVNKTLKINKPPDQISGKI
ncbi:MAG: PAS domain S-box protein [Candidatus Riflebacteria bacterium]|nr:PAS domain S-box protein [Candidatus Riflebacteria bacterium]